MLAPDFIPIQAQIPELTWFSPFYVTDIARKSARMSDQNRQAGGKCRLKIAAG